MSGHSKWHNIRLQKGKADLERGKQFAKLSREITIAAKQGGNPDSNARLRMAIDKAKQNSMPADNIKRATQKGTGELESATYEEALFEGYGPGGVAVLVNTASDNRNRVVADVRHIFAKHGGNLGENGSVAWQFQRQGVLRVATDDNISEDRLMELALEAGADDFSSEDGVYEIKTAPENLSAVRQALEQNGVQIESADVEMVPQTTVALDGESARKMLKLMDALEDHDDVQSVAANFDIAENILQEIGA